jgi:Domain of unknown function (DUF6817)
MSATAPDLERALGLLGAAGAATTAHPSGTLLAHLRGTHDCLVRWGCPPYLCAAGLYHSVYGTELFRTATVPLAERARVCERIGEHAEELVYLYGTMVRGSLYETVGRGMPHHVVDRTTGAEVALRNVQQLADLLTLDVANRLEQLPRSPMSLWRMELDRRRYGRAAPLLPAGAVEELRRVYRPRSWGAIVADGARRRWRRWAARSA